MREADREVPRVIAKRHKLSAQAIYNWCKQFGALAVGLSQKARPDRRCRKTRSRSKDTQVVSIVRHQII